MSKPLMVSSSISILPEPPSPVAEVVVVVIVDLSVLALYSTLLVRGTFVSHKAALAAMKMASRVLPASARMIRSRLSNHDFLLRRMVILLG